MITHLFCWGVFLITCCTLMQQIILTRIFSVIMWYHLSLVSISMTMLGLTLGALVVHFRPQWFDPKDNRAQWACGLNAQICGLSTFLGLFYCLNVPVVISSQFSDVAGFIFWNFMASLPFIFSGIVVCAALTKFPRWVSKIYFYDLLGASIACLFAVWLVNTIDAPSAILFCGVFAQLASLLFFPIENQRKLSLV